LSICLITVYVSAQGRIDYRGLVQSVTKKDYLRCHNYNQEKLVQDMLEQCLRTGKNVDGQSTLILDLECLSMRQIACRTGIAQHSDELK
jgi:hypothetical protein